MQELDSKEMAKQKRKCSLFGIEQGHLYKANPKELMGWARNVDPTNPYNQNHGLFIPYFNMDNGEVYMIDTWHIDMPATHCTTPGDTWTDKVIHELYDKTVIHDGHFFHHCSWDGYYSACLVLDRNNAKCFEDLGELGEYQYITSEDARKYDEADLMCGIRLWRDHDYPRGATLVRKNAKPNTARLVSTAIEDALQSVRTPHVTASTIDDLDSVISPISADLDSHSRIEIELAREYLKRLREVTESWEEFEAEWNQRRKHANKENS